jgi:hypothetical protein
MYTGKTLFAQLMDFLPWTTFSRIVDRYDGDRRVRTLPCTEQFRVLAFAQLTYRESLRDIEARLSAQSTKLYHMGIRSPIKRSTLADANERRDWRIYAVFAQRLIAQARKLYAEKDLGLDLSNTVYALDSTTIDLCLSLFPWAPFRSTKAAVKMHTLLDLLIPEPAAIYDHGSGLPRLRPALRVARCRRTLCHPRQIEYRPAAHLFCTQRSGPGNYLRSDGGTVGFLQPQALSPSSVPYSLQGSRDRKDTHLPHQPFGPPPTTICDLYKARRQVELFFKWIKQHLRIKKFYGTSENAVRVQIWTAVSVHVLVAIIKNRLDLQPSLYTLLQVFSVTLFEKLPLTKGFLDATSLFEEDMFSNQLDLFDNSTGL